MNHFSTGPSGSTGSLSPALLSALAWWKLPRLERLVLSLASDAGPGDDALAVLTGLDAPRLGGSMSTRSRTSRASSKS